MDVSILIIRKRKLRQTAWTMGICPSCEGLEGVRIEDVIEVVSIWFVPVSSKVIGYCARCDFCERPLKNLASSERIGLDKWEPTEGIIALAKQLNVEKTLSLANPVEETRLRSLLTGVEESTSLQKLDVSLGLTTGLILGGMLGVLVGFLIIPSLNTGLDQLGCAFAGLWGGLALGAILGGIISVFARQRSVPFRRLRQVQSQYHIPISALERVAIASCSRVRNAVGRLRGELA